MCNRSLNQMLIRCIPTTITVPTIHKSHIHREISHVYTHTEMHKHTLLQVVDTIPALGLLLFFFFLLWHLDTVK